jgi:FKBP-type peptidyl-prolyl cis-trans isomerase SlyD
MKIADDTAVYVNYYLTANKGNQPEELIEETSNEHPFVFLFGYGAVLPDFETHLFGKQKGDKFDFRIGADKGYGQIEKDYIVKIDAASFMIDGAFDDTRVRVGEDIEMSDAEGNPLVGKVLSINETEVEMDFNHPLAGYDLHFIGEVLEVREATKEELDHGHIHGDGGHHH